jgi:hypothetical protein
MLQRYTKDGNYASSNDVTFFFAATALLLHICYPTFTDGLYGLPAPLSRNSGDGFVYFS